MIKKYPKTKILNDSWLHESKSSNFIELRVKDSILHIIFAQTTQAIDKPKTDRIFSKNEFIHIHILVKILF